MEPLKVMQSRVDDIIFEYRNKSYGAYLLRMLYDSHLRKAMLAGGLIFTTAIAAPGIIDKFFPDGLIPKKKEVKVEVSLEEPPPLDPAKPPPPPPPPPPPTPPPPAATVKYVPPVVKKDEEVPEEAPPPKVEELKEAQVSTKTQEGVKNVPANIVEEKEAAPAPPVIEEVKKEPEVFTVVEQMPTFPDGDLALLKYLASNIKYPALARENGIQGKSIIQFVVDEDGNIGAAKVARGIGGGCDEEALRVVSSMPKWKPGKQRGKAVKVRFTLPVQFRLE